MLTVSLHGIRIAAPHGLYAEEALLLNEFEIDVDIYLQVQEGQQWPFADYTVINETVATIFRQPTQLLETLVQHIHKALIENIPGAQKIRVTIRKMHPPMPGSVHYAQVSYEA